MKHIMVDLETLGTESNSVVVSIAAIQFSLESGQIGKTFESPVCIDCSLKLGLQVEASTIKWWLKQTESARERIYNAEHVSLIDALSRFSRYLLQCASEASCDVRDLYLWGNSNRFDLGKVEDMYSAVDQFIPWNFSNERDMRTLVHFGPDVKENHNFKGTQHNPLDDCMNQIEIVTKIANRYGLT